MSMEAKSFFDKVYDIVADIPEGEILTYGQIAAMVGSPRASRIVGYAMNSAPPSRTLPCHRVVSKTGQLAPDDVFGGKEKQREMLEGEGINFLENGCIDMGRYQENLHAFPH